MSAKPIELKTCASRNDCASGNALQPVDNFYKSPGERDGLKLKCKACICLAKRERYEKKMGRPVTREAASLARRNQEFEQPNPCWLWGNSQPTNATN